MFLVCGEALYDVFLGAARADGSLPLDARAGGSPFNVAIGLARLGIPAGFFAGLSRDALGEQLLQRLVAESVDTRFIVRKDEPTTLSLVGQTAAGTPAYTFYGAGAADRSLTAGDLPSLSSAIDGLHFGSYSIVAEPVAGALALLAERETGRRLISLDPNVRPTVEPDMAVWRRRIGRLAELADVIKASAEDLELLWPGKGSDEIASRWLDAGVGLVVVTKGEAGAIAYSRDHSVAMQAESADVVDTVGAGDAFQAALLSGLLTTGLTSRTMLTQIGEATMTELVAYASRAAAITCGRRGADLPRAEEIGPPPKQATGRAKPRA